MNFLKSHKILMWVLVGVVVLFTAIGARLVGRNKVADETTNLKKVSLVDAKNFLKDRGQISATGIVESLEQAELRSQVSAPVAKISTSVGQSVKKGQVLVSLLNADISAQLASAQANLKSQNVRLDEMKKGTRNEDLNIAETQVAGAKQALEDVKQQQEILVANARASLYSSGLLAVPSNTNIGSVIPTISGSYKGTKEGTITITITSGGTPLGFNATGLVLGSGVVNANVPAALGDSGLFISFPSSAVFLSDTWTIDVPNTKSASYVTSKNAYTSALESQKVAVNAATNALANAQRVLELKQAGSTNDQVRAQEAVVEQAQASVANALAQLDKTIIRSPIDGTISALPVKYGELVSVGQSVVSIVNKQGLQIKAYISSEDLAYVEEGAEVNIGESAKGKVSRVAPSVDVKSKNVEVDILVIDPEKSGLIAGENADVKIVSKQSGSNTSEPVFILPIQAVKISPLGSFVFTVSTDGILEEKPVTTGVITGESVEIKSGISLDMKVVSTVYELKAGDKVVTE
jgi:HlyD family secretion protein